MFVFRKLMNTSSIVRGYSFIFYFVTYKIQYFLWGMVFKSSPYITLNVRPITVSCGGIVAEEL